jgi:uncharacterized membrane protein YdbT with pleckstrin-like domain
MSYIERHLSSGETVLYHTRLHWMVMIGPCLAAMVVGGAGIGLLMDAVSVRNEEGSNLGLLVGIGAGLLAAAVVIVAIASWRRSATEMAVTNRRVLVKMGILSTRSIEIMLSKIESIRVDQSLAGRLFSFGTIVVRGTGGTPEPFAKIAHPLEFRRQVQEQIDELPESRMPTLRT